MDRTPPGLPHQLWARHAGHVTAATSTAAATADLVVTTGVDQVEPGFAGRC